MRTFAIAVLLTASLAAPAVADQCAAVDAKVAEAGAKLLLESKTFVEYCAPCKDKKPSAPKRAGVVTTRAFGDEGLRSVYADGQMLDLAYVYVKRGNLFTNLAALAGCEAHDVPKELTPAAPPPPPPPPAKR